MTISPEELRLRQLLDSEIRMAIRLSNFRPAEDLVSPETERTRDALVPPRDNPALGFSAIKEALESEPGRSISASIAASPHINELSSLLRADAEIGTQIGDTTGKSGHLIVARPEDFCALFALRLLNFNFHRSAEYIEETFAYHFARRAEVVDQRARLRYVAPVPGLEVEFESGTKTIDLGGGLSIAPLPHQICRTITLASQLSGMEGPFLGEFAIEYDDLIAPDRSKVLEGSRELYIESLLDNVRTALRVFKGGAVRDVGWYGMWTTAIDARGFVQRRPGVSQSATYFAAGTSYHLTAIEASEFGAFWNQWAATIKHPPRALARSIRRLTFSQQRHRLDDRLLDLVLALESILLDQEQELRYKFSMRGMALLGGPPERRKHIYAVLWEAYGQRNHVAHGSALKTSVKVGSLTMTLQDLVNRVDEVAREIIRTYMKILTSVPQNKILQELDDRVVEGRYNN